MMRLKRHAIAAITKAEEKERIRRLFGSRDKWFEAVDVFFKHIETRYLARLIDDGLVTTSRMEAHGRVSPEMDPPTMVVTFGHTAIRLVPLFFPTPTSLGEINVTSSANKDRTGYFVCDLTRGWLAPAQETGLRGALSDYLPEKLVVLDEDLFDRTLSGILETREPIVTYDRDRVLERLSHILDDILDPARKQSFARLIHQLRSYPVVGDVKSLGGALKAAVILRLAAPENKVQRLLPRPRGEQLDGRSAEG